MYLPSGVNICTRALARSQTYSVPSSGEIAYYSEILDYGTKTPDWLMQHFLEGDEGDALTQAIGRLYQA